MPALMVPVLAQAIALNLGDRTEARVVRDKFATDLEAETRPYARLSMSWRRSSLGIGYAPVLTVAPLESSTPRERRLAGRTEDRHFELLHAADAQASFTFGSAVTSFTLSQNVKFAQRNFRRELISSGSATSSPDVTGGGGVPTAPDPTLPDPAAPDPAAPAAGGTGDGTGNGAGGAGTNANSNNQLARASSTPVTWIGETTTLAFNKLLSARHGLNFSAAYGVEGGVNPRAQRLFPLLHGPSASASVASQLGPRDGLSTTVNATYRFSRVVVTEQVTDPMTMTSSSVDRSLPTRSASGTATESLRHTFSPSVAALVGAGVGYSRNEQRGRPSTQEVLPTGTVALDYQTIFLKGNFGAQVATNFSPVLDQATGESDWRYVSAVALAWRGKRLTLAASSQAQLSLTPSRTTGTRSFATTAQATYDLLGGFNFDCGGRVAWQELAGNVLVYPTQVAFIGLSYGHQIPID
jgi:hypothetical protein